MKTHKKVTHTHEALHAEGQQCPGGNKEPHHLLMASSCISNVLRKCKISLWPGVRVDYQLVFN